MTKPISLSSIASGSCLRVMTVRGEPASEYGLPTVWLTDSCETVVSLSAGIARRITTHLAIPNQCVSLLWSRPTDHTVIVTAVLTPLSEDGWDMLRKDADSTGRTACMVCWQPCVDADGDAARELNCVDCEPCSLCDRCRVITPSGNPYAICACNQKLAPFWKQGPASTVSDYVCWHQTPWHHLHRRWRPPTRGCMASAIWCPGVSGPIMEMCRVMPAEAAMPVGMRAPEKLQTFVATYGKMLSRLGAWVNCGPGSMYIQPHVLRKGGCANHMFTAASTTAALAASSPRQCAHGPQ